MIDDLAPGTIYLENNELRVFCRLKATQRSTFYRNIDVKGKVYASHVTSAEGG
jgi:hypothetical protein